MQYLGEYYTVVDRVELRGGPDGNRRIWWATARESRRPELHQVKFCAGVNGRDAQMIGDSESFDFHVTTGGTTFELHGGERYVLVVHSPEYRRQASATFELRSEGSAKEGPQRSE